MKKLLFLFLLLIPLVSNAQLQRSLYGTPKGFSQMQGATVMDTVLAWPVRDTTNWNDNLLRKLGRVTVRPQDSLPYWNNGKRWVMLIDALHQTGGSGGNADSSIYVTMTHLQNIIADYLKKSDSGTIYITRSELGDSTDAVRLWVISQHYLTAEVDGSITNELQNLSTPDSEHITISNGNTIKIPVQDTTKFAKNAAQVNGHDDVYLRDRANHTGTQAESTITNLTTDLAGKEPAITGTTQAYDYYGGDKAFHALTKSTVELSNVDNTSDANKPISTATQTALDAKKAAIDSINNQGYVTHGKLKDTIQSVISAETLEATATRGDSTHNRLVAGDTTNGGGILSLFGDSFTLGMGGTAVTLPYPTLLAQYLHLTLKLHAHGGATAHHGTPHNTNGDLIDSMVNLETKPTANSKLGIVLTFNDACGHNADADYSTTNTAASINTFIDNAINNKSWTGKASDIFLATTWCPDTTKITTVCGAGMTMQRFRDFVAMVKGIGNSRGLPVVDLFNAFYNRYNIGLIGSDFYHPKDEGHREAAGDMVAAIDYKIISHGGTLLDAPLYSPDGAPAMALEQGNVRIQNSLTINANPLWNSYLYVPPATNKISATIGYSSFQGVSVNNTWLGFNIYYNSGFKHQLTGYSGNIAFQSGTYSFLTDPASGSADASSSQVSVMALNADGSAGIGGILTRATTTDLTNAVIKIWPTTYHITLGRGIQADSTNYNNYINGTTAFGNYCVFQNGTDYTTGGKKYYVVNQTNLRGQMLAAIPVADVTGAVKSIKRRGDSVLYVLNDGTEAFGFLDSVGTSGGSGETNTASNLGGGLANYSTKVGVDLRFNSFSSSDFNLTSNLFTIDATLKSNWNTAFGWGNHASAGYEVASNKSTSTSLGTSNTLYPSQNAVKAYVDAAISALSSSYVSLSGSYSNPTWITGLAWSKISSTPTTIAGYGITDYSSLWDTRLGTKTTDNLTQGTTNKYYTDALARASIVLTTTGTGAATYNNTTGALNIPTPAGGGGSPGGSNYDIQYNNGGAFAAVGSVVRQADGYLNYNTLAQSSSITQPTAGATLFYRTGLGLCYVDKYGYEKPLQTDMGFTNYQRYEATEGGFNSSTGTTGNINVNGTYSQGALAATNAITKYTRSVYTSAATAGSKCELYASTPQFMLGNTAYGGGFRAVFTFAAETFATTSRLFDGFESGGSGFSNADPSTFTNIIGISKDISETGNFLQFVHNDGTGTAIKVSTGVALDNTAIYELVISVPPNSTTVDLTLYKRLAAGGRTYINSTQVTSDLPAVNTFLNPHIWINNGTVASAIKLDFFKWSIEYQ